MATNKVKVVLKFNIFTVHFSITGAREQNIMKVRVRKKVSILLKAPEAPLFKYVN